MTKKEYKEVPVTYFEFYDSSGIKKRQEKDMVSIVSESVLPYLARLGLYKEFHSGDLQRHWRTHGGLVAYSYRDDLTFEEYALAAEHTLDIPGVSVVARPMRKYIYGALASHILGFVRQPDIKKVPAERENSGIIMFQMISEEMELKRLWTVYLRADLAKRIMLKR